MNDPLWLWCALAALACIVAGLAAKLATMRHAMRQMADGFAARVADGGGAGDAGGTNTLIGIASRDRDVRRLAATINDELRRLRAERRRLDGGDRRLKEAVTNVSHDLRTPLTAIYGYLDLLERDGDLSARDRRYVACIHGRADAMRQLTEELFRYALAADASSANVATPARADCAAPAGGRAAATCDLRRSVEESLAAFYGVLQGRGVTPTVSLPDSPVERRYDDAQIAALGRILGNVIANAAKYGDGDLDVTLSADGVIAVANAVSGFDAVDAGRLFDRYYTLETGAHATGLGLSVARLLTERLGGAIDADCRAGRLTITLSLPDEPMPQAGRMT